MDTVLARLNLHSYCLLKNI